MGEELGVEGGSVGWGREGWGLGERRWLLGVLC